MLDHAYTTQERKGQLCLKDFGRPFDMKLLQRPHASVILGIESCVAPARSIWLLEYGKMPQQAQTNIFYQILAFGRPQDWSQRLRLALISNFPRRINFLDGYLMSCRDFRRFGKAALAADLITTSRFLVEPWHPSPPIPLWTLQYRKVSSRMANQAPPFRPWSSPLLEQPRGATRKIAYKCTKN